MRTPSRDPDDWATPSRGPRHAAPPFRLRAPLRLLVWLCTQPFRVTGPLRTGGLLGAARAFRPAASSGQRAPELRARRALRLFGALGVCAAGLLLVAGLLVLVASFGAAGRPLAAGSSLASDGHRATTGRDGDRRSGRSAQQPSGTVGSVGDGSRAGGPDRAGAGGRDLPGGRPGPPARPIASFAGYGDVVTRLFAVSTNADWQIVWSYRCPASVPAGLLVVEDAAPGAVGAAISASGTSGRGDTWLDPDGRSHRLVVISTCSWTMKVTQNP
jgi:hypothetical protein